MVCFFVVVQNTGARASVVGGGGGGRGGVCDFFSITSTNVEMWYKCGNVENVVQMWKSTVSDPINVPFLSGKPSVEKPFIL